MATTIGSYRDRAEHYRRLAAMISDEAAHRLLQNMARELDEADRRGAAYAEHRPDQIPRSLS